MKLDGSGPVKVMAAPITVFKGMSPDRRWAVAMVPVDEVPTTAVVGVPLQGGSVKRICPAECVAEWSPDGSAFYVEPLLQGAQSGMAIAIPVPKGASIPDLPPAGIRSAEESAALAGSTLINWSHFDPTHGGTNIAPGPATDTFAYTRTTSHRNLFQIRLR